MVEQLTVNQWVVGSNPTLGVSSELILVVAQKQTRLCFCFTPTRIVLRLPQKFLRQFSGAPRKREHAGEACFFVLFGEKGNVCYY